VHIPTRHLAVGPKSPLSFHRSGIIHLPRLEACQPRCGAELLQLSPSWSRKCCFSKHDRANFLKSKTPFPSWTEHVRPTLCVLMNCKCEASCSSSFLANDGQILAQLDPHIRELRKVKPKHADGKFHFNVDLTDNLENLMKTCANGPFMGENILQKLGVQHERKIDSHLSQFASILPQTRAL
jgi:hypothetical protein